MISQEEQNELVAEFLAGSDITIISTEHRSFPGAPTPRDRVGVALPCSLRA